VASGPTKGTVSDWQAVPASDWQEVKSSPAADTPKTADTKPEGFWHSLGSSFGITPEADQQQVDDLKNHPIRSALMAAGGPALQAALGIYEGAKRSGGELMAAGKDAVSGNAAGAAYHGVKAIPIVGPGMDKAASQYADNDIAGEMGTLTGTAAQAAPLVTDAVSAPVKAAGGAARTMAIGDPDAAALRGLQVGARSPKTLNTLKSVQGARPYLQGAQSLEDLQTKIPAAKAEIWQPYQQAVDAIGDRPVKGPDGMTTVRELEAQRAQLSALNRGLKSGSPEAIQLAQQKGMTAAQLLDQERAVQASLDPELASTGIDPKAIRQTFGNVSQVGGRVSGKSTMVEKPQSYGLGNLRDIRLDNPSSLLGKPLSGVRDLIAGRPLFSGKPTDIAIREGFRMAGEKPNLGAFQMPIVKGLLQAPMQEIPLGEAPGPPEMPGGVYDAKPFPPQNVGEARITRNRSGQMLPMSDRLVEFPDESGKLPVARNYKGQMMSRQPTRQAWMTGAEQELPETPPLSGPGVLLRRPQASK
jgi:hypothetical protein